MDRLILSRRFCGWITCAWIFGLASASTALSQASVNLYFIDPSQTHLAAQVREIPESTDTVHSARAIVTALMEGPKEGLLRSIPEELTLRAVFITDEKRAVVDLARRPEARIRKDAFAEWLAVCSIVNSLILNLSTIDSVQILMDGEEAETLWGHIDVTRPFKANMLSIR